MKRVAVPILATLLAGGTYHSHAQDTTLIAQQAYLKASNTGANAQSREKGYRIFAEHLFWCLGYGCVVR